MNSRLVTKIDIDFENLCVDNSKDFIQIFKWDSDEDWIVNNDEIPLKCIDCKEFYYDIIQYYHPEIGRKYLAVNKEDWKKVLPIIQHWENELENTKRAWRLCEKERNKYEIELLTLKTKWYVKLGKWIERKLK